MMLLRSGVLPENSCKRRNMSAFEMVEQLWGIFNTSGKTLQIPGHNKYANNIEVLRRFCVAGGSGTLTVVSEFDTRN